LHDPASRVCCAKGQIKPQSIRALRLRAGVQKSIAYECTSPRCLQACTEEPRGRIKNAVPSKKPNRCCGADTDMSERARAYSKVHSKIDRAASRERSLISPSAMLNVYLNAKKAARLRVPRRPEGPSQVQACHTTSPVRALVF